MVYETTDLASRASTCRSPERVEDLLGGTRRQVHGAARVHRRRPVRMAGHNGLEVETFLVDFGAVGFGWVEITIRVGVLAPAGPR